MKNRKQKIYTLTANPALDLSGHVLKIVPNEKNYVHQFRIDPGGNGVNAARIVKRLGGDPLLLGFLGGPSGAQFAKLVRAEGLRCSFTQIREATRTNITVTSEDTQEQTRLTFPGPEVQKEEQRDLFKKINALAIPGILIIGGSVPGKMGAQFYSSLIRHAQKRGLRVIVDVPAPELKKIVEAKLQKMLLIKPNQVELEDLLGKKLKNKQQIAQEACKLLGKSELVCVSLGAPGAILAYQGQAWFIESPKIKSLGTVGAGDSMVGAISSRLAASNELTQSLVLDALCWGVAAGAATASTAGTSLGKAALIRKLVAKSRIQKIL